MPLYYQDAGGLTSVFGYDDVPKGVGDTPSTSEEDGLRSRRFGVSARIFVLQKPWRLRGSNLIPTVQISNALEI